MVPISFVPHCTWCKQSFKCRTGRILCMKTTRRTWPLFTFQALHTVNKSKATYEKTAKDIKVKHTAQKDEMMKAVTDNISKVLEKRITEVDQVYDPACQKLSVHAEAITNYLEKVEKSLHRTSQVLKNSKLRELMTAEKMIDDDIQMLQNEKPQNLTSFQVQVDNPGSCVEKFCFYATLMDLAVKCEYLQLFQLRFISPDCLAGIKQNRLKKLQRKIKETKQFAFWKYFRPQCIPVKCTSAIFFVTSVW